jgi:hypothetical protein
MATPMTALSSIFSTMRLAWAATALLTASCASFDSRFTIEVSPALPPTRQTVSIVGALKNGRLDEDYWHTLQPALRPLGDGCDSLFGERLQARAPELYESVDAKSRDNGVDDELLHTLEPHALGQLVMVAYSAGQLPSRRTQRGPSAKQQRYPSLAGQHSGRGYHEMIAKKNARADDDPGLDLSLYFYSLAAHANVAQVSLHYTGQSVDEANRLLGDKLRALFSDFRCVGWR